MTKPSFTEKQAEEFVSEVSEEESEMTANILVETLDSQRAFSMFLGESRHRLLRSALVILGVLASVGVAAWPVNVLELPILVQGFVASGVLVLLNCVRKCTGEMGAPEFRFGISLDLESGEELEPTKAVIYSYANMIQENQDHLDEAGSRVGEAERSLQIGIGLLVVAISGYAFIYTGYVDQWVVAVFGAIYLIIDLFFSHL